MPASSIPRATCRGSSTAFSWRKAGRERSRTGSTRPGAATRTRSRATRRARWSWPPGRWPWAIRAWLAGEVAGVSRLRRLDMALEWLWRNRLDAKRGLIWSGFTADWGDVESSYADQRAIKLSDRSQRTYSIYTQALFIQAAQKLVLMAGRMGDKAMAGQVAATGEDRRRRMPQAALSSPTWGISLSTASRARTMSCAGSGTSWPWAATPRPCAPG